MPDRYLGTTLGKYRMEAILGSGGFAWVYKAWDPELEIPVAIKILKPQFAGDEKFEERFRREASTAARLRHPNIIKIYAVGRDGEAVYFAMDYLPTGLADRLDVMSTLPESMLIRMAIDVASGLGFAHREGVIHRDIKTDNILFDDHGNAVVADFGIARAVSGYTAETGTNMVVGTPQYFSPEQARGIALDGRADIYSLGITLFRAAAGVLPFSGDDWYEIARQQVEDDPPMPRDINPALSREMEDIILQCLEKNQDGRFPTGEALCDARLKLLEKRGEAGTLRTSAFPAGSTLSAPKPALRLRRRLRRVPRMAWAGAGASGLLLAALLAWGGGGGDSRAAEVSDATTDAARRAGRLALADTSGGIPIPGTLRIHTPDRSAVSINGVTIAAGLWEADTLPPGRYTVEASVQSIAGCPTASLREVATLADTGLREMRLNPRGCGRFDVDVAPENSQYLLTAFSGDVQRAGQLPLRQPLILPVGVYRLRLEARFCAPYVDERLWIQDDRTTRPRVRLICERR